MPVPRSMSWLCKILHSIVTSKMSSDAVDLAMDLPMSSYAAFSADWMRNRFGVEALVRKGCMELEKSLRQHRDQSLFIELMDGFFDGKYGSAEQRAFLHCYSLVGDVMDRLRLTRDSVAPREISLSTALDILKRVLPYASDADQQHMEDTLFTVATERSGWENITSKDSQQSEGANSWDKLIITDHQLYIVCVKERMHVQTQFHKTLVAGFRRFDTRGRAVISYAQARQLLSSLVPWMDANVIHGIIGNVCPELLMTGAVIDVPNMLMLDARIDVMGCNVNSIKLAKDH